MRLLAVVSFYTLNDRCANVLLVDYASHQSLPLTQVYTSTFRRSSGTICNKTVGSAVQKNSLREYNFNQICGWQVDAPIK